MRHARVLLCVLLCSGFLGIAAAATPTPAETACAPEVRVTTRVTEKDRGEPTAMVVTLEAAARIPGGDKLTRVSLQSANNATLAVNGAPVAVPVVVNLDPPVTSWSFSLRRGAVGVPYLATFTVTDLCGEIPKFVGAGASAGVAPTQQAVATPTQQSIATPTQQAVATPTAPPAPTSTPTRVPTAAPTQSVAVGAGAVAPVRLASFYRPLSDGATEAELARVAGAVILTRSDEAYRDRLRAAGYRGPITQYLLAFETSGPAGLANGGSPCGGYQPYVNNMSGIAGDFCAALHGDERNFLHNGRGERLYGTQSWQEGGVTKRAYLYLMNPAAPGWRAYAARRAREELAALRYDGIFLDNVDLSLWRAQRQEANSDGVVAEFASNAAFQEAVAGFLQAVKAELGGAPLWANLSSGTDAPDDWNRYAPHLDGFMNEYFVARWGGSFAGPAVWETQLRQVEAAAGAGKTVLAIGQGGRYDAARMRFALASYLLVAADGVSFRYGDGSGGESTSPAYYQLWRYPEYDARLGAPTGPRYQDGGTWRRDFACGTVSANPSTNTGTIVVDPTRPGCS